MKRSKLNTKRFVVCIDNSDYRASLELHKIYQVLPDDQAAADDFLRVVDESGEDYLYSARRFVPVELPQRVERSVSRATKESTIFSDKAMPPSRSGSPTRASATRRVQKNALGAADRHPIQARREGLRILGHHAAWRGHQAER